MGRYVGNRWHEELPSSGPADQVQGNSEPVQQPSRPSGGDSGGGGGGTAPAVGGGAGFNTANGYRTVAQMAQELQGVGWGGDPGDATAVIDAYRRTTGGDVVDTNPGGAGNPSVAGGTTQAQVVQQQGTNGGLSAADLAAIKAFFGATSGMSQKDLDEKIREFNATLDWQKQMWQQQGLPQLAIQQRAQQLEEQKFQELTRQAQFNEALQTRQQDLAEKVQLGQLSIAQANQQLQDFIQRGQLAVSQGQLGLDTLKTAATLTGPSDWVAAANFSRGVANSALPAFVQKLLSGQSTATLGANAPGASMPGGNTLGSLASRLTTGGTNTPTDVNASVDALNKLFSQGGQALGPQQLEGLTPSEMDMLKGGGNSIGADVNGWLAQYARSRIGQQASNPGVATSS